MTRPLDQADLIAEDFYLDLRPVPHFGSDAPETRSSSKSSAAAMNADARPTPHGAGRPSSPQRSGSASAVTPAPIDNAARGVRSARAA